MRASTETLSIPNYTIVGLLGEGGLGKVYKAFRSSFGLPTGANQEIRKYFAIKVIDMERAEEYVDVDTLYHEIGISAQFNYPNIVQVIDFGKIDNSIYIVMEMLEGYSLGEVLALYEQPLPEDVALTIVYEIAKTLRYVHFEHLKDSNESIVHADISLQNIFIEKHTYRTKLMDFGCAKIFKRGTQYKIGDNEPTYANLFFAAPEQARQQWLDVRSDLFSLGIVFYDLVTNTRQRDLPMKEVHAKAIDGRTVDRSILQSQKIVNATIINKLLELDPAKRYQSADQLIETIERRLSAVSFSYVNGQKELQRIFSVVDTSHAERKTTQTEGAEGDITRPLPSSKSNQTKLLPKKPVTRAISRKVLGATSDISPSHQPQNPQSRVRKNITSRLKANNTRSSGIPFIRDWNSRKKASAMACLLALISIAFFTIYSEIFDSSPKPSAEETLATKPSVNQRQQAGTQLAETEATKKQAEKQSQRTLPDMGEEKISDKKTKKATEDKNDTENQGRLSDPKMTEKPTKEDVSKGIGGDSPSSSDDSKGELSQNDDKNTDKNATAQAPLLDSKGDDTSSRVTKEQQKKIDEVMDRIRARNLTQLEQQAEEPNPVPVRSRRVTVVSRASMWRNLKIYDLNKRGRKSIVYNKPIVSRSVIKLKPGRYRLVAKHPKFGKAQVRNITVKKSQRTMRVTL